MKKKNFIIILVMPILLISLLFWTGGCKTEDETAQTTAISTPESTAEEPVNNDTANMALIKTLVEDFGKVLANVSLLGPSDILEEDMQKYYGPFVSGELISQWIQDPSKALGRLTSSPWPDHIEIIDVKKISDDKYEVTGNVVEIASVEASSGGYAAKYGVSLTVERLNDGWIITEVTKNLETSDQETIMGDFNELLVADTRSHQVISFIDENIGMVSPANADFMLEKLEEIQKDDQTSYTDLLFEDNWQVKLNMIFNRDIEAKDLDEIEDTELKNLVSEIFNGGFKLIALEGSFYPVIDYEFIKKYSGNITPQYQDYLNIMARQSNKLFSRDAAITISWDELALRLAECEEFFASYPEDNVRRMAAGELYINYLRSYMIGQDNTPTYSYEDNKVKQEVLDSYDKFIADYPDYVTSDLIKSYKEILADSNNTVNDEIFEKVDDICNQASDTFGI